MSTAPATAGDRWLRRRAGVSVARALGTPTRAAIYDHLREAGEARTVRDVAEVFELHPNVARTHLETLADAGLVVVGRRKHPGGGRPAKVYLAGDDAPEADEPVAQDSGLLVRILIELVDPRAPVQGPAALLSRAHEVALAEGRRLAADVPRQEAQAGRDLEAVARLALRALRPHAAAVRVVKAGSDWVDVTGTHEIFAQIRGERPHLADALERGLLAGAVAGSGAVVTIAGAGTLPDGGQVWRARQAANGHTGSRTGIVPAAHVDARGLPREAGVVHAMRAITVLRGGDALEVFAEGPGSPAAFARWADRAGHELLGVERAADSTGRPAIRLLIRKGA